MEVKTNMTVILIAAQIVLICISLVILVKTVKEIWKLFKQSREHKQVAKNIKKLDSLVAFSQLIDKMKFPNSDKVVQEIMLSALVRITESLTRIKGMKI